MRKPNCPFIYSFIFFISFFNNNCFCQTGNNIHVPTIDTAEASTHFIDGMSFLSERKYEDALLNLKKALTIFESKLGGNHERVGDVYLKLAVTYYNRTDFKNSKKASKKALDIYKNTIGENHLKTARVYYMMGQAAKYGQIGDALYNYEKSLGIRKNILGDSSALVGECLVNIGFMKSYLAPLDSAQAIIEQGREIQVKSLGANHIKVADTYNYLGICHYQKGDYFTAAVHYEKALAIAHANGLANTSRTLNYTSNIGLCRMQQGDFQSALGYFEKAVIAGTKLRGEDHFSVAIYLHNAGACLMNLLQFEKALVHLEKAFVIRENLLGNYHFRTSSTKMLIGECYTFLNKFEKAEKIYLETIGHKKFTRADFKVQADAYYYYAELLRKTGRPYKALENFDKSIEVLNFIEEDKITSIDNATQNAIGMVVLGMKGDLLVDLYRTSDNDDYLSDAKTTYNLALEIGEKTWAQLLENGSKQRLTNDLYPVIEGAIEIEYILFEKTKDSTHLENAFLLAEKNRNILLKEGLQNKLARNFANIPSELLDKEEKLQIELNELHLQKTELIEEGINGESKELHKITSDIYDKKQTFYALVDTFEKRYPDYYELKYSIPSISQNEIKNKLKKDEALIEYFFGDSTLFIFIISQKENKLIRQPIDDELNNSLDTFLNAFYEYNHGRKTDKEWENEKRRFVFHASYLYEKLIIPALKYIDEKNLIIISDGKLAYLPFDILLTDEIKNSEFKYSDLPYFLHQKNIRTELSAALLKNPNSLYTKGKGYVGFAPSYWGNEHFASKQKDSLLLRALFRNGFPNSFDSLKFNQKEVLYAQSKMGGKVFVGGNATESLFMKYAPNASIVHLPLHAWVHDKEPLQSFLAFTDEGGKENGLLHGHELFHKKMSAALIILNACKTGYGKLQRGEGVMSLARAFKFAQCPNILMNRWDTEDSIAYEIMGHYIDLLVDGTPKAEALTEAKKKYLKNSGARHSHPFYWANLSLIGDNEVVEISAGSGWAKQTLVFLAALLLLIFFIWRRKRAEAPS